MNKIISAALAFSGSLAFTIIEAVEETVRFVSQGTELVGTLYLPNEQAGPFSAVLVTGAWTTVREQMPAVYAQALAEQGLAAFTFDFRGWGESAGDKKYLEDPVRKIEDIIAAANYLTTRKEIAHDEIYGLGICASAGYMVHAVNKSEHIHKVALVAPWLHDKAIVEQVYGGKESVENLIALGRQAEAADKPVYLEAASTTNEKSLMFQVPYYTEVDRGAIAAYDNKFNVASWVGWLNFEAMTAADDLDEPLLVIHSEAAAIPHGARQFIERVNKQGKNKVSELWLENVSQFDFYDQVEPVKKSVQAVVEHFNKDDSLSLRRDKATLESMIKSVGNFADFGQFAALEELYADEVLVDYSSLTGVAAELKSNQQLMSEWASVLPGFDRTHHNVSNIVVKIDGALAHGTAEVVADHYVDLKFWQVSGTYTYEFQNISGEWKIIKHVFQISEEKGTRDVFTLASNRVAVNPHGYLLWRQNRQVVVDFLKALEEKNMEGFATLWVDDAVQEMPYAPKDFPQRVQGKENLVAHYAKWPSISANADFTSNLVFHRMQDPQLIFAEWDGAVDIISTGRHYAQRYVGLFHIEKGKIQLFREYFNPLSFAYAFALEE